MSLVDYDFESGEEESTVLEAAAAERKDNTYAYNKPDLTRSLQPFDDISSLSDPVSSCVAIAPESDSSICSKNSERKFLVPASLGRELKDDWSSKRLPLALPSTDWSGYTDEITGADNDTESSDSSTGFGSEPKWNASSALGIQLSSQMSVIFGEKTSDERADVPRNPPNPYLLESIMKRYCIDAYRSNFPSHIFDSTELRANREEYDAFANGTLRKRLRRRSRIGTIGTIGTVGTVGAVATSDPSCPNTSSIETTLPSISASSDAIDFQQAVANHQVSSFSSLPGASFPSSCSINLKPRKTGQRISKWDKPISTTSLSSQAIGSYI